jgi:hypothetical protein
MSLETDKLETIPLKEIPNWKELPCISKGIFNPKIGQYYRYAYPPKDRTQWELHQVIDIRKNGDVVTRRSNNPVLGIYTASYNENICKIPDFELIDPNYQEKPQKPKSRLNLINLE